IRCSDFSDSKIEFDYVVINSSDYESRNKIKTFFKLMWALINIDYKILIYSGWETVETIPLFYLFSKKKNAIVIESSIVESSISGLKGFLKKKILNRCSIALPSGKLQKDILLGVKYTGEIYVTHGVGILNSSFLSEYKYINRHEKDEFKFLYVGRLSEEKNVRYLVEAFNINGLSLTIIGDGPEYKSLVDLAKDNIDFKGYINNKELPSLMREFNALVLPSLSEAWGLVIEEAIYSHIPVLVSENVGCQFDLVDSLQSGVVFPLNNIEAFNVAIYDFISGYDRYLSNVKKLDYRHRIKKQLESYESIL
ncbi:glycosyltransferase, partial [Vibrio campbellii]|uniref:glycosyltransferase n=1 Tax=Vibrio campbellii TaxID=680 RepID=UPI0005EF0B8D